MSKRIDETDRVFTRELLIGFGEASSRKSHYPELRQRLAELEQFKLLLDQALDVILLLDAQSGGIIYANSAACSYLGCTKEELVGTTLEQWLEIPGLSGISLEKLALQTVECSPTRKEGSPVQLEISINKVALRGCLFIVIVGRDITERKELEEEQNQVFEELHANYEELQSLYQQLAAGEEILVKNMEEIEASKAALAESETRYRLAMEGAHDAIWDWDMSRDRWTVSPHWLDKLGIPDEPFKYLAHFEARIHPDDVEARYKELRAHLAGKTKFYQEEFRVKSAAGEWLWVLSRGKALFDLDGNAVRASGSYTDITVVKQQQEQIRHIAFHDGLTGLPNRYSLSSALADISRKYVSNGGILLLDLDNFKLVNDSWGHSAGDVLLNEVAKRLQILANREVTIYRPGGDEFVLLINSLTADTVALWAERVWALFETPVSYREMQMAVTTSMGAALFSADMASDDVMRHADIALHQAKIAGRQSWRLYEAKMQEPILERSRLERELLEAIKSEQFILYYQPQYNLAGVPVAMEALIRWQHPKSGLVPPLTFIPIVEETGMIIPLGDWVLRSACQFGKILIEKSGAMRITVNVSAKQLMQDDFAERVLKIVEQENFPAELLELELTETVLMESFDDNVIKLSKLRACGIRISLDDFGTGYSSLTYLSRLPIDTLKIDKSFLAEQATNWPIVGIIIALAHELKLAVVAEGVETVQQLTELRKLGCDYIQGYFANPPLRPEAAQEIRRVAHPKFL